ncbi:TPA: restriction endonuclease subunit S [Streptococcus suis]|nr:restriction endonuclease subunit S [Streptococcus suis]
MSEWKLKNLKDLSVSITSGLTPLKNNSEYWDNPVIPWLKTDQLGEKYIWDTNTKISEIALEKTSLKLYPPKTLSIAMYGEGKTRGNISIIMKPMATNQACCNIIINDEKADFEYVYYYMKTQYESLRGLSSGVRNNLNANDIKNYEIRIPESIVEQNNISKVLSVLDQKIAINNQINEELEAMAKTLYDYWFVQFNFPDENGKPYKSSGGKMVYNDQLKREIPEGWGVENLSNFLTIKNGKDHKDLSDGDYPVYGSGGLMRKVEDYIFEGESVLIPRKGTLNNIMYVDEKFWTVDTMFYTHMKIDYATLYTYFSIKDIDFTKLNTGTGVPSMTASILYQLQILNPNADILKNFDELVRTTYRMIFDNHKQNQELNQLRDWLLPMLMNGQVKVEE